MTSRLIACTMLAACLAAPAYGQRWADWRDYAKDETQDRNEMADTRTWIATADGDMSNTDNYSGGALPIDGDSLLFDGSSSIAPSSNLNALAAVELVLLWAKPTFTAGMGSSGSPVEVAATKALIQCRGAVYLKHHTIAVQAYYIDKPRMASEPVHLDGAGATSLLIFAKRGHVNCLASLEIIDGLWVTFKYDPSRDTYVSLPDCANELRYVYQSGGEVVNYRQNYDTVNDRGHIVQNGGLWTQEGTRSVQTLHGNGGTFIHNSSGIFRGGYIQGGFLDFAQNKKEHTCTLLYVMGTGDYQFGYLTTFTNPVIDLREEVP